MAKQNEIFKYIGTSPRYFDDMVMIQPTRLPAPNAIFANVSALSFVT